MLAVALVAGVTAIVCTSVVGSLWFASKVPGPPAEPPAELPAATTRDDWAPEEQAIDDAERIRTIRAILERQRADWVVRLRSAPFEAERNQVAGEVLKIDQALLELASTGSLPLPLSPP